MTTRTMAWLLLMLLPACTGSSPERPGDAATEPLHGAWGLSEWTSGRSGRVITEPEPGIFLFTGHYYSVMHVTSAAPRRPFANRVAPTDQEKLEAYDSFFGNSGRFDTRDSVLVLRPMVARSPSVLDSLVYAYRTTGDTLWLEQLNGMRPKYRLVRLP